ncbi:hypothetical protein ACFQ8T_12540 [Isoptericola sp. NPDC056618]|uniref:hypothetical protein n=1 Tax=Isoptericola sp. NPDC056618 TaxID=3345878 RepID=UPI0036ACC31D
MTTEQPTAMDRLAGTRPSSLCRCGHARRTHGTKAVVGRGVWRGCDGCPDYRPPAEER